MEELLNDHNFDISTITEKAEEILENSHEAPASYLGIAKDFIKFSQDTGKIEYQKIAESILSKMLYTYGHDFGIQAAEILGTLGGENLEKASSYLFKFFKTDVNTLIRFFVSSGTHSNRANAAKALMSFGPEHKDEVIEILKGMTVSKHTYEALDILAEIDDQKDFVRENLQNVRSVEAYRILSKLKK